MSPIIILIITYKRLQLCLDTIQHLKQNLIYGGQMGFHIADSGSGLEYTETLRKAIGSDYHTTLTTNIDVHGNTQGVGANMNLGTQAAFDRSDIVLHVEDDWRLATPFDLNPCVELLESDDTIAMIRLGYISAGVQGKTISGAGKIWWRLMRTPGQQYIYSGHPNLRHKRFWDTYGPYPEDTSIGHTELAMCNSFNTRSGPDIIWPAWKEDKGIFIHTGDSQSIKWQDDNGQPLGYDINGIPLI